jgi:murein DD-endopeptidase MepM/ murein hydrolase activator NlpD
VAALCLTGLAVPASALSTTDDPGARKKKVDSQIEQLKSDMDETNAALAAAHAALVATQAKLPGAQAALAAAQAAADEAAAADAQAAQELQIAQANQAKALDQLRATNWSILNTRGRVKQFAAQIYQEQGLGQLDVAMNSQSPQQFADRLALVGTVMDLQSQSIGRLEVAQADQTAQRAKLKALEDDSARAKVKAEQAVTKAVTTRDAAAAAKNSLDQLAATQAKQEADVKAQADAERKRLDEMTAESNRLSAELAYRARQQRRAELARLAQIAAAARAAGRPATTTTLAPTPTGGGVLTVPMPGAVVTSEFGLRFHPILHYWRLHAGRDYAAPCGTPVHAAADGVIVSAGWGGGYGNRVVIDHGLKGSTSLSSSYNHLQSIAVSSGSVSRGQVIGYEGTTGLSNGCHLHFEVYENGTPVDPRRWL